VLNDIIHLWNELVGHFNIPGIGVGPFHTPEIKIGDNLKIPELRADGGDIYPGRPYVIGERGAELVFPGEAGRVVSNAQIAAALSGSGGRQSGDRIGVKIDAAIFKNDADLQALQRQADFAQKSLVAS
jgi:hypothetical protein